MAGLGIRLFTDEMIFPSLAPELRRLGYDAESCPEAKRSYQKISDYSQLAYATQEDRTILTFNRRHFVRLDRDWHARGRRHGGIIISDQVSDFHELVRRVRLHLDTVEDRVQRGRLLWLRG